MKQTSRTLQEIIGPIPKEVKLRIDLSIEISDRLVYLMQEKGLSKKQFADALGKRPSEIAKWLSGQHNFTLDTISKISVFFGKPIIAVV